MPAGYPYMPQFGVITSKSCSHSNSNICSQQRAHQCLPWMLNEHWHAFYLFALRARNRSLAAWILLSWSLGTVAGIFCLSEPEPFTCSPSVNRPDPPLCHGIKDINRIQSVQLWSVVREPFEVEACLPQPIDIQVPELLHDGHDPGQFHSAHISHVWARGRYELMEDDKLWEHSLVICSQHGGWMHLKFRILESAPSYTVV